MWQLLLEGIEAELRRSLGPSFDQLSSSSRRCLFTEMLWAEIALHVGDRCDAAPAICGAKALELELKRCVVTPRLIDAIQADLTEVPIPEKIARALRGLVQCSSADGLCLGQCVAVLRCLAQFRDEDWSRFRSSATGRHLSGMRGGSHLLGWRFITDLQTLVAFRNQYAHEAAATGAANEIRALVTGGPGEGLLPFILRCSQPRKPVVGSAVLPALG